MQNTKLTVDTRTLYAAGTGTPDTTVASSAVTSVGLEFNTALNSSNGEATLTLSPNGILTPTLTNHIYLVLGYHFAYSP